MMEEEEGNMGEMREESRGKRWMEEGEEAAEGEEDRGRRWRGGRREEPSGRRSQKRREEGEVEESGGAKSGFFPRGVRVPGDPRNFPPSCWRPVGLPSFIPFLLLARFLASSPPLFLSLTFLPSNSGGESCAPVANRGGPAKLGVVWGGAGRSRRRMGGRRRKHGREEGGNVRTN